MARRHRPEKREIIPDPRFGDVMVSRMISTLMIHGKKSIAEKIIYGALDEIESVTKQEPLKVFKSALDNARPMVEVVSRRLGGATYQVPVEVRSDRSVSLGMRWLRDAARKRKKSEKTMASALRAELLDASQSRGGAVKKREETHRMAESNKAFSHYRW
jgi:small subunit ribosomal protein S7